MAGLTQRFLMRNCTFNGEAFSKAEAAFSDLGFKPAEPEPDTKRFNLASQIPVHIPKPTKGGETVVTTSTKSHSHIEDLARKTGLE